MKRQGPMMTATIRAVFAVVFLALGLALPLHHNGLQAQVPGPYVSPNIPQPVPQQSGPTTTYNGALPGLSGQAPAYQLGSGDKVRITVFGEPDLTGEFEINSDGVLSFPLVGEVPAKGLSPRQLGDKLVTLLKDGFLVNPKINVEVINYRPFFILGEVTKPGGYPFVTSMTVVTAVALAGGYTPRANKSRMTITRTVDQQRQDIDATESTPVLPEDIITVHERFF
jgi:polysaccharide export outer membrane protein